MHEPVWWAGRQICELDFPPWLQGWGQPYYPGGTWQPRLPCPCPLWARECESSSNCSAHSQRSLVQLRSHITGGRAKGKRVLGSDKTGPKRL